MQRGLASEPYSASDRQPVSIAKKTTERGAGTSEQIIQLLDRRAVDLGDRPAQHVEVDGLNARLLAVLQLDQEATVGAALAHATPLKAAGVERWRPVARATSHVNVPERPVIVAERLEILRRAGCIGIVIRVAREARVQQDPNVK